MKYIKETSATSATFATIVALTFVSACNIDSTPESVDIVDDDPSLDEVYTVTVVDLDRGGEVISQKLVSKREQVAQRERLEELEAQGLGQSQEAIVTQDSDCVQATLVGGLLVNRPVFSMWSQANYVGDRLCLAGDGNADLNDYCRIYDPVFGVACIVPWGGTMQGPASFKVSIFETSARFFKSTSNPCGYCSSRAGSTNVANSDSCELDARYLSLDANYICPL